MREIPSTEPPKTIGQLADLLGYLRQVEEGSYNTLLFRGHGSYTYALTPSLFREKELRKNEKNILREMISLNPSEFASDRTVFEQLVRMQHHSLPTRLLDLTFNPLVALYFACKDCPDRDGELIILSAIRHTIRYFDSDTVSCVAGLSNLTGEERNELREIGDQHQLNFSGAGKRLLQFIRMEKPHFLAEIVPNDLHSVWVVRPKLANRRIIAQQGAFLLFGLTTELREDNQRDIAISRLRISGSAKEEILKELDRLNVNEVSLFPEIDHAANYIKSQVLPSASTKAGST
jgi:hypothetical protein